MYRYRDIYSTYPSIDMHPFIVVFFQCLLTVSGARQCGFWVRPPGRERTARDAGGRPPPHLSAERCRARHPPRISASWAAHSGRTSWPPGCAATPTAPWPFPWLERRPTVTLSSCAVSANSHGRCSPQFVLTQVVDVQRLASVRHDLLLLLPLSLLLASLGLCLEERNSGQSEAKLRAERWIWSVKKKASSATLWRTLL